MSTGRSRPLRKDTFSTIFKTIKPITLSESFSSRPSALIPNIRALSWSPNGSLLATCTSANIRIWNPERPNVKSSVEIRNGHNSSFAGSPGGSATAVEKVTFCPTTENLLASTGLDGGVRLWDIRSPGGPGVSGKGTALADYRVGDRGLFLTWHPNGTELLSGRSDDVVHVIDVRNMTGSSDGPNTWEMHATDRSPVKDKGAFNAMAFSNSGQEVFATTAEGPVKILDYSNMSVLHTLSGHTHATYAVQQSAAGEWVATGGGDGITLLWNTYDWQCAHVLKAHTSSIRDLSFSFDGAYLVVGSGSDARDGTSGLEVYHTDVGDVVHTVDTMNPVTVAAWHPQRYWVAFAGDPGGLKIIGPGSSST
jgi:THO complex subunit 3